MKLWVVALPFTLARASPAASRPAGRPADEEEPCSPLAWPGSAADFSLFSTCDCEQAASSRATDRAMA
ncbi:hypothetical protein G6F63_016708 [Rhizopus arrhizus]|nr:hypothetical protein G6F63_016708 [Rhizopus arrhizus]